MSDNAHTYGTRVGCPLSTDRTAFGKDRTVRIARNDVRKSQAASARLEVLEMPPEGEWITRVSTVSLSRQSTRHTSRNVTFTMYDVPLACIILGFAVFFSSTSFSSTSFLLQRKKCHVSVACSPIPYIHRDRICLLFRGKCENSGNLKLPIVEDADTWTDSG